MSTGEVGTWFGLLLGLAGGVGIVAGGWLADKFGAKDPKWYLWTTAIALVVMTPFNFLAYNAATATASILGMVSTIT